MKKKKELLSLDFNRLPQLPSVSKFLHLRLCFQCDPFYTAFVAMRRMTLLCTQKPQIASRELRMMCHLTLICSLMHTTGLKLQKRNASFSFECLVRVWIFQMAPGIVIVPSLFLFFFFFFNYVSAFLSFLELACVFSLCLNFFYCFVLAFFRKLCFKSPF